MRGTDAADGFGCVLGRRDVVVKSMSEEHGILDLKRTDWRPQVGDKVRIMHRGGGGGKTCRRPFE